MSKQKNRYYRKILKITHAQTTIAGKQVPVTQVLYCVVLNQTTTTVKTSLIGYRVYVGGRRFNGVDAWHPAPTSINLKNPLASKFFEKVGEHSIKRTKQNAFNEAFKSYIMGHKELSKHLTGTVRWWSHTEGMIYCKTLDMSFDVHACNIKGAKTWYPETACMYLKESEPVTFDLWENDRWLSAKNVLGGHFDADKWNRLDHDSLAFKCDENGNAINGLFAPGAGLWDAFESTPTAPAPNPKKSKSTAKAKEKANQEADQSARMMDKIAAILKPTPKPNASN